jgi:hypothetical protein
MENRKSKMENETVACAVGGIRVQFLTRLMRFVLLASAGAMLDVCWCSEARPAEAGTTNLSLTFF